MGSMDYTEADCHESDDPPGWIWAVYPSHSSEPMVSIGHSGNETKARRIVERELATVDDNAFGVVIGPRGTQHVCRRTDCGGFNWRPLFGNPD